MHILLFGATGRTGCLILNELLNNGHSVNIIVRDRAKVKSSSKNLTILEGSTLDKDLIAVAISDCDAIISALNISRNSDFPWSALRTPKTLLSETIQLVIKSAESHNIKRIIVLSAWGANETIHDIPWWFRWTIKWSNISYGYKDHERQEDILKHSAMDWTAVRPVGLINSDIDKPLKVSLDNRPKPFPIVSRKSIAEFTVDVLETRKYIKLAPAVSWQYW